MKQACPDPWPSRQWDPCRFVIPYGIFLRRVNRTLHSPHNGSIVTRTLGSSERNSLFLNVNLYNPVAKHGFGSETSGVRIPALPLTSYVTLSKQLCTHVPQFPPLENGDANKTYQRVSVRVSKSKCLKLPSEYQDRTRAQYAFAAVIIVATWLRLHSRVCHSPPLSLSFSLQKIGLRLFSPRGLL